MIDVTALRAETPACETLTHLNNAGASLMPTPVRDAVFGHLQLEQRIGAYEAEEATADARADFYAAFADMLGCDAQEIAFADSATRAWDSAFHALPLEPGDRVMVHASAYASNYLALLQLARRKGLHIDPLPSDASGAIDLDALPRLLQPRTRLVLLTHCPSQSGLVQPAEAVGRFARDHGLLYLLDACQSAGQMPLDVEALDCDALTGTGRKFLRGPRGTGFLYMRKALADRVEPAVIDNVAARWTSENDYDLAPGARRFECYERHVAGQIGLGRAVRYALDVGLKGMASRIQALAARLRDDLSALPGVTVHDPGTQRSGIVTFSKADTEVRPAQLTLRAQSINVSTVGRTTMRLDAQERGLPDMLRASVHAYNSDAELDVLLRAVDAL